MRPVRESLLAWVCETSKARSIANRSDVLRATTSTFFSTASGGGDPSSVVTWKTPVELPPMLMGTHRAEHPRPRRCGQASSAVLSGNTMVRALDAAGHSSGDMTRQPASSAWAVLTSTCRKWALLESARSNSDRMPGAAWLRASATRSKTDGSAFDISSAVCRVASKAILCAMSNCAASSRNCLRSTRSACRPRTVITVTAMARPMAMDHNRSTRALLAAARA